MQKVIFCKVTDEYVQGAGMVVGAAGSHNDVVIELEFSPLWDGTTKQAVWKNALGGNPTVILLNEDEEGLFRVPVPYEAKEYAGDCTLSLKGVVLDGEAEKSATLSASAKFSVLESGWNEGEEPAPIPADQAFQLQTRIEAVEDALNLTGTDVDYDYATERLWLTRDGVRIGTGTSIPTGTGGGGADVDGGTF